MPLHFFTKAIAERRERKIAAMQWKYQQSVLSNLGLLTLVWGGIEIVLDTFFDWYAVEQGAKRRPKIPQQTQEKVKYLREIAGDPRWSATEQATMSRLADEVDRLAVERRNFIHGHLFQNDKTSLDWRIYRIKIDGGKLVRSFHDYHNDDINRIVREVTELSNEAAPFFGRIVGLPEYGGR